LRKALLIAAALVIPGGLTVIAAIALRRAYLRRQIRRDLAKLWRGQVERARREGRV
jgi:hypothetical protein